MDGYGNDEWKFGIRVHRMEVIAQKERGGEEWWTQTTSFRKYGENLLVPAIAAPDRRVLRKRNKNFVYGYTVYLTFNVNDELNKAYRDDSLEHKK